MILMAGIPKGSDRESCNNCFNRTLDDNTESYCIIKHLSYKYKVDIFFTWCNEYRYEFPEWKKSANALLECKRELKII